MKEASFTGQQLGLGGIKYSRVFSILDHILLLLFIYLFFKKTYFWTVCFLVFSHNHIFLAFSPLVFSDQLNSLPKISRNSLLDNSSALNL